MAEIEIVQRRCQYPGCRFVFVGEKMGNVYCPEHATDQPGVISEAECIEANKAPIVCSRGCIELVAAVLDRARRDRRIGQPYWGRGKGLGRQWSELAARILSHALTMSGFPIFVDSQELKRVYRGK